MSLSLTHHSLTISVYEPNEKWNFQQCQITGIHLIHLCHPISHVFVNEILCYFESSGIILFKVAGFCLVKRWKDGHLLIGVEKNDWTQYHNRWDSGVAYAFLICLINDACEWRKCVLPVMVEEWSCLEYRCHLLGHGHLGLCYLVVALKVVPLCK